jgi:nucleoside-diphosphate-sugar epimerase
MDVVFHVGGVAGLGGPWQPYYASNVVGTQNIIDGCLAHGVGRLVFTSSPSVTFDGRSQEGVDESVPYPQHWLCNYSRSKAMAEQRVLAANGKNGLRTCALRPHLIWGPRDRHLIPRFLADARSGRLRRVGNGKNRIDIVYVENAARAHLQAADAMQNGSPVPGRAYFITQGEPVNGWDWVDEILALAGLPPVRKSVSFRTAWAVGAAYEAAYRMFCPQKEPPMTRFLAAQLSQSHYFSIARAKADFGYEPTVSIAEGMRRLAAAGFC